MIERIQKFMLYYAAMVVVLVGVRYFTKDSADQLRDLQTQTENLIAERAELQLQLANLESPARVRRWAYQNDMVPFSSANATREAFESLPAKPEFASVSQKITVRTQWR
jgi:hypothetical protein